MTTPTHCIQISHVVVLTSLLRQSYQTLKAYLNILNHTCKDITRRQRRMLLERQLVDRLIYCDICNKLQVHTESFSWFCNSHVKKVGNLTLGAPNSYRCWCQMTYLGPAVRGCHYLGNFTLGVSNSYGCQCQRTWLGPAVWEQQDWVS